MTAALRCAYRASLRLFPADFRRYYAHEMEEIFEERIQSASRVVALRTTVREVTDVVQSALRLRIDRSAHLRPALVAGVACTIMVALLATQDMPLQSRLAMSTDSVDFNATDPAGEFTLSIRKGRPVAATIDRVPLPPHRLVHAGDSIQFIGPHGGVVLAVAYDRQRARIEWEARPQACRGQATSCVRYQ